VSAFTEPLGEVKAIMTIPLTLTL